MDPRARFVCQAPIWFHSSLSLQQSCILCTQQSLKQACLQFNANATAHVCITLCKLLFILWLVGSFLHECLLLPLQAFAENVLLCGGGSRVPGLEAKFLTGLQSVSPPSMPPAMCSCPDYMPENTLKYSSWMGAAILSKVCRSAIAAQTDQSMSVREHGQVLQESCWHSSP